MTDINLSTPNQKSEVSHRDSEGSAQKWERSSGYEKPVSDVLDTPSCCTFLNVLWCGETRNKL